MFKPHIILGRAYYQLPGENPDSIAPTEEVLMEKHNSTFSDLDNEPRFSYSANALTTKEAVNLNKELINAKSEQLLRTQFNALLIHFTVSMTLIALTE